MRDLTTLRGWLESLEVDELELVVERHAITESGARLRGMAELAARLEHPATVYRALAEAPLPIIEIVEAVSALGEAATLARLTELLAEATGTPVPHEQSVRHWVDQAATAALLWVDGDRVRINPGVDQVVLVPLALAPPVRRLLEQLNVEDLRLFLGAQGLPTPPRRAERVAALEAAFGDFAHVRRLAAAIPSSVWTAFNEFVAERLAGAVPALTTAGRALEEDDYEPYAPDSFARGQELARWAVDAGLSAEPGWGYGFDLELASEVLLALAPPTFRAPFHPEPPVLATAPAAAEQVARTASAAVAQFLGAAMAVLEGLARGGLKPLKAGGVGARELTRFAKEVGTDVATVRLTLEAAAIRGLLALPEPGRLAAGPGFEQWRRLPPPQRALDLVLAWKRMTTPPTRQREADDSYRPALTAPPGGPTPPLGHELCRLLARMGRGVAVTLEGLHALYSWHNPATPVRLVDLACAWNEAHSLGVLADGALTLLGEAIAEHHESAALALLEEMLPAESGQVLFGSDLTVVVPGSPPPATVDLLDVLGRREGHGVANTWRLSEASVRDALDAGYVVDDLIEGLRSLTEKKPPQAMEYLLRDVARKHGRVAVRPAAAVLTCDDEGLLAEIVGERRLHALGLSLLAPTVAVSSAPTEQVLGGLRAAGYLPSERGADGAPAVEVRRLPAAAGGAVDDGATIGEPEDLSAELADLDAGMRQLLDQAASAQQQETPRELAERLVRGETEAAPATPEEEHIGRMARRLSAAEVHELADAVVTDRPVLLHYRSESGSVTTRIVSRLRLSGPHLVGFCHSKRADRYFRLERILGVAPAG